MRDTSSLDGFGGLGLLLLGMGIISWPLLRPPLTLTEPATPSLATQKSSGLCPSGLAYEPYCYGDTGDTLGIGTDLIGQHYGKRVAALSTGLGCTDSVGTMIVMLPDPIASGLANSTDAALYAVSRAHERAGFVLDRYWLPWSAGTAGDSDGQHLRGQPGAVLYRRTGQFPGDQPHAERSSLSLVYLVGETPTQGLDRPAFRRALTDLLRLRLGCPTKSLKILGPYFSSGAPGLAAELDLLRSGIFLQVNLVSGSATASSTRRLNRTILLKDGSSRAISFHATVHSDSAYQVALARLVDSDRLQIKPGQIANLTEQATAYGQSILQSTPDAPPQSDTSTSGPPLEISFPMNIATIRSAYEAAERSAARKPDPVDLGPKVSLLDGRSTTSRGGIPLYSGVTVATQEIFLNQIGSMLAERRILLAGLQATDPRDKLFLARELHRRLPNLQFYTYESNSLFLRPDYEGALKGMLVLSTYPLIPDPRRAQGPELMPSDPATGMYNATLVQLGESNLVSYSSSLIEGKDDGPIPPVWITVVGAGSIQPLRIVPDLVDRDRFPAVGPPRSTLKRQDERPIYRIVLLTILFALGLRAVVCLKGLPLQTRPAAGHRSWVRAWCVVKGVVVWLLKGGKRTHPARLVAWFAAERGQFSAYALLVLLIMLAPFCIIFGAAPPGVTAGLFSNRWVLAAIVAVPIVAGILLLLASMDRLPRDRTQELLSGAPLRGFAELGARFAVDLAAGWFVIVGILFTVGVLLLPERDGVGILFWLRTRAMDARLSPLLVILLVGLTTAFWAWWHRRRAELLQHPTQFECALFYSDSNALDRYGPSWTEMRGIAEKFRWHLALLTPSIRATIVLLLGFLAAYTLWSQTEHVLERGLIEFSSRFETNAGVLAFAFQWILWFGLVAGLVLTLISVERLLSLWVLLRQTLRSVAKLPLDAPFDRLSPQAGRLTQLVRLGEGPDWRSMQNEQWLQLANLAEPESAAAETPEEADDIACRRELAATLRRTPSWDRTRKVMSCLTHYWAAQPTAAVAGELQDAMKDLKEPRRDGDKTGLPVTLAIRYATPDRLALWIRTAEECAASEIIEYIDWALGALRHTAAFLAAAMVCTSLLIFVYPFAYERFVQLYFFLLFLVTIGALGWMTVDINKNEVISRITRTTPGRLTWDRSLVTNLFVLVGVPIVSYVGTAVPELHHLLLGWLQPLSGLFSR